MHTGRATHRIAGRGEFTFRHNTGLPCFRNHLVDELGPVNTCMVVATEAIFSQDKAARVPCSYATQVSANAGLRGNGPVPAGCA